MAGIMNSIRPSRDEERGAILAIIDAAAEAYRDTIPADRWHEPYMPLDELEAEIAAGVEFWGCELDGVLTGVMGIQPVRDVTLVRHAYVAPGHQGSGIGSGMLHHLLNRSTRPHVGGDVGGGEWAIRFYQRHGFEMASPALKTKLLKTYWTIPERQIETSVVLANPPFPEA
ncbi:MAG: GNAT family N-acetyltransferase [Acidobacteriaceae bacterium]